MAALAARALAFATRRTAFGDLFFGRDEAPLEPEAFGLEGPLSAAALWARRDPRGGAAFGAAGRTTKISSPESVVRTAMAEAGSGARESGNSRKLVAKLRRVSSCQRRAPAAFATRENHPSSQALVEVTTGTALAEPL